MVSRSNSNDSLDSLDQEMLGEDMPSDNEEPTQQAGPADGSTFAVQSSAATLSDAIARMQPSQSSQPSLLPFTPQPSQPSQPSPTTFTFQGPQPSPLLYIDPPDQGAPEETSHQPMKMEVEGEGKAQQGERKTIPKARLRRRMGTSAMVAPSPPMALPSTPGPLTSVPATYSFTDVAAKEKELFNAASHQAHYFQSEHLQKQLAEMRNEHDETIRLKDDKTAILESKRRQLEEELTAAKERYEKLKILCEKSAWKEKGYQDRLSTQETAIQAMEKQVDDADERVQEANKRTGQTLTELNHYKQQLSHCEGTLKSVREEKLSLQTQFDNLKEREKQIRTQAGEFEKRAKEAEAKLNNYPQEFVLLKAERDRLKAGLDAAQDNIVDLKNDCEDLRHEQTMAHSEFSRIKNELADMEKTSNLINQIAKERENELDLLRPSIERQKKLCEENDEAIRNLRAKIASLKAKLASTSEEVKEKDETIRLLQTDITASKEKLASTSEDVIKEKDETIGQLHTDITALKGKLASASERPNKEKDEVITLLQTDIMALKEKFASTSEGANKEKDEIIRHLQTDITALKEKLASNSEGMNREKDEAIGLLQTDITALKEKLANANEEIASHNATGNRASSKVTKIKERIPTKTPISHTPSFADEDDEWSRRMEEFFRGKVMPESEEEVEEKDDVENVVREQQPALSHSAVVTIMEVAPTVFSHPPVPRGSPAKVTISRSLSLYVWILPLLFLTWLGWTFVMGRMDRRRWVAANQGTRRAW